MSDNIKILDPSLASKIAAGEVIERPASVLKELMENSLDAGAKNITVVVAEGGKRLIKVIDDGDGISRQDAPLAFLRHATSKIKTEDDLENITTMGFRGEALYSIAAVSRARLCTRRKGELTGTSVEVEGVDAPVVSDEGCPEGTAIEVKDLFFNIPARLKFLRSNESEFGRILDIFKRIALANPGIRFRLTHGSSKAIDAPAGDMRSRIADLFGKDLKGSLIEVNTPFVKGFISRDVTYSTTSSIYLFINGRPVRDKAINRAIIDGYGAMLDGGRYPFTVLDIQVPPGDVDVNIHPAKSEVRFKNPRFIYDSVKAGIRGALGDGAFAARQWSNHPPQYREISSFRPPAGARESSTGRFTSGENTIWNGSETPSTQGSISFFDEDTEVKNPEFLGLEVIGQVWGEFLLAQSSERGEFYIIDAHGAAERAAFERLKKEFYGGNVKGQMLLLPERVETTPEEKEAVMKAISSLSRMGFEVAAFGPSLKYGGETFMIKAVPDIISARSCAALLKDIAAEIAEHGGSVKAEGKIEAALMRVACHSVIRGMRVLTKEEGKALLEELSKVDFAGYCPHGRPVVKKITRAEIEAMFKR